MPWNVSLCMESCFVEEAFTGSVTPQELQDSFRQVISAARERGFSRILSDCSSLKGGHSVFDLFVLADDLKAESIAHTLKQAVILPEDREAAGLVRFWETTCSNRGIRVRIFEDRQKAIDWLTGS
jgi:hypothetical protein